MYNAEWWIQTLHLEPHPEGGYYRRMYTAEGTIPAAALPPGFHGPRPFATAIYYLLEGEAFSSLHRLRSDELWHFHYGSPLTVHIIDRRRRYRTRHLGLNPEAGQALQAAIRAGWWFGATVDDPAGFTLVSCTVAPGFDFAECEQGRRRQLLERYPEHRALIERLTRE